VMPAWSRIDDETRTSTLDHARCKDLRAMNHAQRLTPRMRCSFPRPTLAARLDAGVVHQNVGAAEALPHGALQSRHLFDATDVNAMA